MCAFNTGHRILRAEANRASHRRSSSSRTLPGAAYPISVLGIARLGVSKCQHRAARREVTSALDIAAHVSVGYHKGNAEG
eukprot:324849-Rhodomonas_salina.2